MFSWETTLVAALLVAGSIALVVVHVRSFSDALEEVDEHARAFSRQQFRRRIQASGMIGVAGLVMFAAQFVEQPTLVLVAWGAVAILMLWVILLATADYVATQSHFGRLQRDNVASEVELQAELIRHKERRRGDSNGHTENGNA